MKDFARCALIQPPPAHLQLDRLADLESVHTDNINGSLCGVAMELHHFGKRPKRGTYCRLRMLAVLTLGAKPQPSNTHTTGEGIPIPQRYLAALAILIGIFMGALDTSIVNVALPTISQELKVDPAAVIWVANAYHVASAATMITFAAIGAAFGRKKVYSVGIVLFTVTSLGCALSADLGQLVLFRCAQGLSYAAMVSIGIGMYRSIFPPNALGKILGINALIVALGTVAGPTAGGIIITLFDWPWLFLINIPLGAVAIYLSIRYLPDDATTTTSFDLKGSILSVIALASFVVAVDQAGRWSNAVIASLIALSFAGSVVFLLWQKQAPCPLLPLDIFSSSRFSLAAATSLGAFTAQGLSFIALPFLLQSTYGYSAIESAFFFTPWPLAVTIAAPMAGWLADKIDATLLSTIGVVCLATGLGAIAALGEDPTIPDILWRLTLCGFGFGFFQAPNNREMLSSVSPSRSGVASGVLATARTLGQSLGAAIVAVIMAGAAIPFLDFERGDLMHAAMWLACGIATCAGLISAKRIR